MMNAVTCNLAILMEEKGIQSISELRRKTGLPRLTLIRLYNDEAKVMSHKTAYVLCEFFDCKIGEMFSLVTQEEKDRKAETVNKRRERNRNGFVYFAKDLNNSLIKIGKSVVVKQRLYQLKTEFETEIELIATIADEDSLHLERKFHEKFDGKRVHGEWFDLSEEDINNIIVIAKQKKEA